MFTILWGFVGFVLSNTYQLVIFTIYFLSEGCLLFFQTSRVSQSCDCISFRHEQGHVVITENLQVCYLDIKVDFGTNLYRFSNEVMSYIKF